MYCIVMHAYEGHHTVKIRNLYKNLMGGNHLEGPCKDSRIMLKWALRNWVEGYGLDSFGSEEGPVIRFFENGNETSNCIRD